VSRMKAILARLSRSRLGRSRPVLAGLIALVVTATTVFATPSPGMADGDFYYQCSYADVSCQTGVLVTSFSYDICKTAPLEGSRSTRVCIDYEGDYVYVKDGSSDGWPGLAVIVGGGGSVYKRLCRNPHTAGTWARCNFNWGETSEKDVYGGIVYSYSITSYDLLWSFSGA
jgi:hypothetical protein